MVYRDTGGPTGFVGDFLVAAHLKGQIDLPESSRVDLDGDWAAHSGLFDKEIQDFTKRNRLP